MLADISIDEAEKWDGIVRSFKAWDVYYLSGYSQAFRLHGDGEPTLFYYDDRGIRAVNVVMKRDIQQDEYFSRNLPPGSYYDITTPYGYGGFLVEGEAAEGGLGRLDDEYSSFCRSRGIISEFVRFHPVLKNSDALTGVYDVSTLGKTISMHLHSAEQIWGDLTSENRNMIRKAQKAGVEILWGRSAELYTEFRRLYGATMDCNGAMDYYYFGEDFFDCILNGLQSNAVVFYAVHQRRTVAMSIVLFANEQMHYHLSALDREYRHLAPTNLLLYEAARWGCENGYRTFHLGGGVGSSEDRLYHFKSAFNRRSYNTFSIGRKIFDEGRYDELVEMRKAEGGIDDTTSFFPKYRAIFGK